MLSAFFLSCMDRAYSVVHFVVPFLKKETGVLTLMLYCRHSRKSTMASEKFMLRLPHSAACRCACGTPHVCVQRVDVVRGGFNGPACLERETVCFKSRVGYAAGLSCRRFPHASPELRDILSRSRLLAVLLRPEYSFLGSHSVFKILFTDELL